jgi:argininosuccinate lyase
MAKLWSKGYEIEPLIEQYQSARNAALDAELVRHDLWGSFAQARMLHKIGLLDDAEWAAIDGALRQLLQEAETGALRPNTAEEDIHTTIEHRLVELVGDAGKKIHTGRSRNDQVLLDLRLYAKEHLLDIAEATLATATSLLELARQHEWTPMPGYTHMQRGMLSSIGLWASAYAEALLDDCVALAAAYTVNDQSPLGSAAAYGAPLPLDRAYVADLLGFARPHHNVLTAANARGKGEATVVQALALIMLDLSKWAQDVLLYTTREYNFLHVPQELCSGSSIMPQKRNLDTLELVRARAHTVIALQGQMLTTLAGLPSGYNMDYQETKAPFIEAVHLCKESLKIIALFASRLEVDQERLQAACTAELFATDRALDLARQGTPFRDAYVAVATTTYEPEQADLAARLRERSHEGAPGNLDLDGVAARISTEHATWEARRKHFEQAITALTGANIHQDE